jgi:hypothetical protein
MAFSLYAGGMSGNPGLHARGAAFSTFGQSFRYNSAFFQAGRFRRAGIVGGIFQLSLTEYNHE